MSNLFERYDIDPRSPPEAITERMRELCEDAEPELRDAIRAEWEELTMHPERRLILALGTFPETRPPFGQPPVAPPPPAPSLEPPLVLAELWVVARVAAALTPGDDAPLPLFGAIGDDPLIDEETKP